LKSFTLFFDTAVITHSALRLAGSRTATSAAVETSVLYAFILSALLAIAGMIAVGINYAGFLARSSGALRKLRWSRFLASSQLSFCAGLAMGPALHRGNVIRAGDVLFAYGGIGLLVFGLTPHFEDLLGAPGQDEQENRQKLQWFFAFVMLLAIGWRLKATPEKELLQALDFSVL
jgi:hypothetical protein